MKIAYICTNCRKAYYNEDEVKQVNNELYVCKNEYDCKGRFLRLFREKKIKDFVLR